MVAGQGSRVYFNSFLSGHFFFFEIDRDGVTVGNGFSFGEGEPAVGSDHQVMCPDDLCVDDEFGFKEAGVVVDGGIVSACWGNGNPAAHVPGLDDKDGVGWANRSFVVEDDGIGDAFGDYFIGGKRILGWVDGRCVFFGTEQGVKENGEG